MFLSIPHPICQQFRHLMQAVGLTGMSRYEQESLFLDITGRFDALISRICWCYADKVDDYNDLRQDVLTNIWRSLPRFRGESEWSTWIYRITLNTCMSTIRKSYRRRETTLGEDALRIPDSTDDSKVNDVLILYSLIRSLNPVDRAIVTLWLDEKTYEDIAKVMGMNRNTVATRLHRIKQTLAKHWPE